MCRAIGYTRLRQRRIAFKQGRVTSEPLNEPHWKRKAFDPTQPRSIVAHKNRGRAEGAAPIPEVPRTNVHDRATRETRCAQSRHFLQRLVSGRGDCPRQLDREPNLDRTAIRTGGGPSDAGNPGSREEGSR